MRVVTWNIHSAVGIDGELSVERVASLLAGLDPDVVALQEVPSSRKTGDQPALISDALGWSAAYQVCLERRGFRFGNLLLTRGDIASVMRVSLPGAGEPRGLLVARVRLDGRLMAFGCTHLGLDEESRALQKAAIVRELPRHTPFALAGDFNERPEDVGPLAEWLSLAEPRPTFPSPEPVAAIDLVLVSAHWAARGTRTVATAASDHLPLVADLELLGE